MKFKMSSIFVEEKNLLEIVESDADPTGGALRAQSAVSAAVSDTEEESDTKADEDTEESNAEDTEESDAEDTEESDAEKKNEAYQLFFPKKSFDRLVKEIAQDYQCNLKFQAEAINILQVVSEEYLLKLFYDSQQCANHAKRDTLTVDDMRLVKLLRKNTTLDFEK